MKLVHVWDSELNMDASDVTVHEVILFSSILRNFFVAIFIVLVYTHVFYRESFALIGPSDLWEDFTLYQSQLELYSCTNVLVYTFTWILMKWLVFSVVGIWTAVRGWPCCVCLRERCHTQQSARNQWLVCWKTEIKR